MKTVTRRDALRHLAGISTAAVLSTAAAAESKRSQLAIVIYALGIHQRNNWAGRYAGLSPALAFLEECHSLGAAGIQCSLGPTDTPHIAELRRRAEKYSMRVEAIIEPPRDSDDVARFEREVRIAKDAGADFARTVIIPGRRYERFKTLAEFHEFEARGLKSLQLAEPVLARHRFRFAMENHKDQVIPEKLDTLKRLSSEWIGICVDIGNNVALMEDPVETARAFAPFAFNVHIKDLLVQDYPEGWLLADVALGDGFIDLKKIVEILRAAKPKLPFSFETITRDPLKVPVRTHAYWTTIPGNRADLLARMSRIVKSKQDAESLVTVSQLPLPQQLALEHRNIQRSLAYAQTHLGL
jgi:3-oxoisoapionate decarboxylase